MKTERLLTHTEPPAALKTECPLLIGSASAMAIVWEHYIPTAWTVTDHALSNITGLTRRPQGGGLPVPVLLWKPRRWRHQRQWKWCGSCCKA